MKKIHQATQFFGIVIFFVIGLIVNQSVFAQADVISKLNYSVAISVNGRSFILPPAGTVRTNLLPNNSDKEVTITWTENNRNHRSKQIITIVDGKLIINEELLANSNRQTEASPAIIASAPTVGITESASIYRTKLLVINQSSHRFLIREGKFAGLALKPGQTSDSLDVNLGLIEFILLVDLDRDSLSSGRNYMQKVVTGIIVKDQTSFLITDHQIHIPFAGDKTIFYFFNETRYDVVGVGSASLGMVIGSGRRIRKKIDANEGFINTAWQYIDEHGNKRQANSEFVIYKGKYLVYIREKDLAGLYQVK